MYRPLVTLPELLSRLAGGPEVELQMFALQKEGGLLHVEITFVIDDVALLLVGLDCPFQSTLIRELVVGGIPWSDVSAVHFLAWPKMASWFNDNKKVLCYHSDTHGVDVVVPLDGHNDTLADIETCIASMKADSAKLSIWLSLNDCACDLLRDIRIHIAMTLYDLMYAQ